MNKQKKAEYIKDMSSQFDKSEAVIVAHYQGLTVSQLDELRAKMREHGIQFKITKTELLNLLWRKQDVKIFLIYSQVQLQLLYLKML